jgi:hypothetical protein
MTQRRTYRADPFAYLVLVVGGGTPALVGTVGVLTGAFVRDKHILTVLSLSWLVPIFAAIWLARFRLRFDERSFTYDCLFRRRRSVEFADVKSAALVGETPGLNLEC